MSSTSASCGSGKRISREPFLFESAEKGACLKVQKNTIFVQTSEVIVLYVLRGTAEKSLCKCKEGSKNTERVFVEGDTVDIVWPAINNNSGNVKFPKSVWVVVTKQKNGKKRMWLQALDRVQDKLKDVKIIQMSVNVIGTGAVKEGKGSTKSVRCVCVCLDGTRRLWIEEGTFPSQSILYSFDHNESVFPSTYTWTPPLTLSPSLGLNLHYP